MNGVSDAAAALERGRAVLLVTPPAVEHAGAVWELLTKAPGLALGVSGQSRPAVMVICSDTAGAEEWAAAAPPELHAHPVTGLGRSIRLLKEGRVDFLAGAPEELQALVAQSALKLDTVGTVVLAWPEWLLAANRLAALEQLLNEVREARRIVLAWNPPALEDLLERYARRPHVVGDLPLGDDARPLPPVAAARYAVIPRARRQAAMSEIQDALNRPRIAQWTKGSTNAEPADAVVCVDLPTRADLAQIAGRGEPVLMLSAAQLPYARSIAAPLTPLPLPAARDRAAANADAVRARLAAQLEAGGLEPELALLEPLLQRYDAAEVAAALLAMSRQPSGVSDQPNTSEEWVKVFVNVGRKDRASAKDFVGALTREVGLSRTDIGRVELREAFSLLEIAAPVADKAIAGLSRTMIRGRRPSARRDRDV